MKKSAIAWAAVLALALTSCGNAPSEAPETEPKTTVETLHVLGIEPVSYTHLTLPTKRIV